MYGLRNEKPLNSEFSKGLFHIDLSNNNLSDMTADAVSFALSNDIYIKSLNLSNNKISEVGCKKFSWVLKTNDTLLNVDLRGN